MAGNSIEEQISSLKKELYDLYDPKLMKCKDVDKANKLSREIDNLYLRKNKEFWQKFKRGKDEESNIR